MSDDNDNIKILMEGAPIGTLQSFTPSDRPLAKVYELPEYTKTLVPEPTHTYTAQIQRLWLHPHLSNIFAPYSLQYRPEEEKPWKVLTPHRSESYVGLHEAIMQCPFRPLEIVDPIYSEGMYSWRLRQEGEE